MKWIYQLESSDSLRNTGQPARLKAEPILHGYLRCLLFLIRRNELIPNHAKVTVKHAATAT